MRLEGSGRAFIRGLLMPHRLLLADDSVTIQRVIELTFADEDVQVIAVGDGQQAIDRIATEPPDIVLADVGMPGRDGYEVASYVKSRPSLAHIPVLLLTGAFEPVDQERAREVGCDGILAKPFEPQLLITRVKELLGLIPVPTPGISLHPPVGPTARAASPTPASVPAPAAAEQSSTAPGEPTVSLDEYFDRLDAAFATINAPPAEGAPGVEPLPSAWGETIRSPERQAPVQTADGADSQTRSWPELDLTSPAAPAAADAAAPPAAPAVPPPGALTPPPPVAVQDFGEAVIADAFTALLAVEQGETPATSVLPVRSRAGQPAVPLNELVDRVTEQVLQRLTDRVVRETVGDIVSAVAERLVREEIERIRATIK